MSAPLYQLQNEFERFRPIWLAAGAKVRHYAEGDIIYPLHTAWQTVSYIDEGLVHASIRQGEKEKLVAAYGRGMLMPFSAPESVPISHRIQFAAATDVVAWEISTDAFQQLLKDADFNQQMMTAMWQLIHLLLHEVQSLSFDTGLERVASFLYTYFENTGRDCLEIGTGDLQAYIGLNRSNLNKYLAVLVHDKIIRKQRGSIRILSPTKLRTYCAPRIIECSLVSIADTQLGQLDNQEKWQAIRQRDASYDGTFWYGVRSTGIYCVPSCQSRLPGKENIVFFSTPEEAEAAGFRPCKRCRPDIAQYQPNQQFLLHVKSLIDNQFDDPMLLRETLGSLPVTVRHLNRLFKLKFHQTIHAYLMDKRLQAAAEKLCHTDESVVTIALTSGFHSMSSFYTNFKRAYGMPPQQYRQKKRN